MSEVGIRGLSVAAVATGLVVTLLVSCVQGETAEPQRGYYTDVAPILAEHCQTCHVEDSIAPMAFHTYEDAAAIAPILKQVVASRVMPPYTVNASGECNKFRGARWLTEEQIGAIVNWVDSGTPKGTYVKPPEPTWLNAALKEVDAVGQMQKPYGGNWDDPNIVEDYRCFVVDPGIEEDQFLVGFNVLPGQPRQVHHVILFNLTTEESQQAALDVEASFELEGYPCYGGPTCSDTDLETCVGKGLSTGGAGLLAIWAPGMGPTYYPDNTGVAVPAGAKFVMQVHYDLLAGREPDFTSVEFDLEKDADLLQMLPLADFHFNLPPGESYTETTNTMAFPNMGLGTATIHGMFPHMHELGSGLEAWLKRGDEEICLLDVQTWDWNWQGNFFYEEPLTLEPGDVLTITCKYNTEGQVDVTKFGESVDDEMCLGGLFISGWPAIF